MDLDYSVNIIKYKILLLYYYYLLIEIIKKKKNNPPISRHVINTRGLK